MTQQIAEEMNNKQVKTNVEQSCIKWHILKPIVILHYLVTDDTVKLLIGKGEGEDVSLEDLHIGQVSCLFP